jgi:hypothetical protein
MPKGEKNIYLYPRCCFIWTWLVKPLIVFVLVVWTWILKLLWCACKNLIIFYGDVLIILYIFVICGPVICSYYLSWLSWIYCHNAHTCVGTPQRFAKIYG